MIHHFKKRIQDKFDLLCAEDIISVAAKFSIESIKALTNKEIAAVRVMPNICATVGESMSAWIKSREVRQDQIKDVAKIIALQTASDAEDLRKHVTSKGGTIEAAFKEFDKNKLPI